MALDSPAVAPETTGPKFTIITKDIQAAPASEDGRRRFRATASSTIIDRSGDEIELAALQKAAEQFRRGLTIYMNHDFKNVESAFGLTDHAELIQRGIDPDTKAPIWDLDIEGVVNVPNPRAVQLADSIDGGYARFGTSITAYVRKHKRHPATGGMKIADIDVVEASIVGVPDNQRSWAQKAAVAIKSFNANHAEIMGDDYDDEVIVKGDLSAASRNNLSDSEFACPEQRKYPINDAAHVRAALSRIADPSNDQCGRDKIIAAARKFGIGEHASKALDTESGGALQKQGLCSECKHKANCDCTTCDCGSAMHQSSKSLSSDDLLMKWVSKAYTPDQITVDDDGFEVISKEADVPEIDTEAQGLVEEPHETGTEAEVDETPAESEGVQESDTETPETTPAVEAEADPPVEKAASYSPDDVAELVQKTAGLVEEIGRLREQIAAKDERIAELEIGNQSVSKEVDLAQEVIEKVMGLPLRAKTAGYVETFTKAHGLFAPEVVDYLNKRSSLSER